MSDPSTINKTASIVNEVLKGIIEGTGADAIKALLIADVPWLGLPFIKQIFGFIVDKLAGYFYVAAANAATKIVIDVQIKGEESSVLNSFNDLQMAIASGDTTAITKASANLDDSYKSLIHYDGSASA